jgi:hypothetical protein
LEITKTVLSLMLVMITILTTLTTTSIAAYAGRDHHDGGDGNKQKAEDESAAAIADCDDNEVKRAGFDCIAIATNDVEIETSEEEPPGEGLVVCKEVNDPNQEVVPFDFRFIIRFGPETTQTQGVPPPECSEGELFFVGEYEVTEDTVGSDAPPPDVVEVEGDCTQDPTNPQRATGEVEEGETETCTFINTYEDDS